MERASRAGWRTSQVLTALVAVLLTAAAQLVIPVTAHAAESYKGFPVGQCTYYAAQEFDKVAPSPGVNWRGNAGAWYTNAQLKGWAVTSEPDEALPGSVIVWSGNGWGHVGVVRQVTADTVSIDEMNWGAWVDKANAITVNHNKVTPRTIKRTELANSSTFRGFILPMTAAEKLRLDAERKAEAVTDKVAEEVEAKTDEALDEVGNAVEAEAARQLNGCCGGPAALVVAPALGLVIARRRRRR